MYIQADQIFIKRSTLFDLVQTFKENEVEVVMPRYGKKLASPKLISATFTKKLLALTGDEGAKGIVRNCNNVMIVTIEDEEEIFDVDTVEDLRELDKYS
jgi:molybdenum cofactor cytidylyltransferase